MDSVEASKMRSHPSPRQGLRSLVTLVFTTIGFFGASNPASAVTQLDSDF